MILERELYKSISTTRAITKSLRIFLMNSVKAVFSNKSSEKVHENSRGLPELVNTNSCGTCSDCISVCPTAALEATHKNDKLEHLYLDVRKCIFCGLCEEVCSPSILTLTDQRPLSSHGESSWTIDLLQAK